MVGLKNIPLNIVRGGGRTMNKNIYIFITILFLIVNVGCSSAEKIETSNDEIEVDNNTFLEQGSDRTTKGNNVAEDELVSVEPEYVYVKISAVGDVMVHSPQFRAQFNKTTNTYDFTNNFSFIKPHISSADLALANLETTFAGMEKGFSGFPFFNTPDELAYALKYAGFDVISTANNHIFDRGKEGILRTIQILEENNLEVIGTRRNEEDESFIITEVNGIKIGITAYAAETPRQGEVRAINSIRMPKEVEAIIDTFGFENLEEDLIKMKERIQIMKQRGAEIIVFYMHWGNEYWRQACKYQVKIAQALTNYGADVILGSHPHVIQPIEFLYSQIDGSKTVVAYSMGNILSNQRYETLGNKYTEDGVIVNLTFKKNSATNKIILSKIGIVPTWVHRYVQEGQRAYEIIPVVDALPDGEKFNIYSKKTMLRIKKSLERTLEVIDIKDNKISLETRKHNEPFALEFIKESSSLDHGDKPRGILKDDSLETLSGFAQVVIKH
ncbi:MAG: capsule biosynthesis protein CapA [Alkaliphilus sp.]|nr:MAG: capsule biosynthesis protein CapA [Alkaliphilus sp.]